ncbi:MAG: ADP-ribosylation factor-like protein [archaeon]|nr:ADP-ribosylation factor-like protein [archaeon]
MNNARGVRAEIKIIVVGNAGTGKTSFCRKWMKDEFYEGYQATLVVDFSYKIYEYKGFRYKVQLWDIGGKYIIYI